MPVKRPHSKSRYGCDRCRKRRVKCDEKHPCCSICSERQEMCHYSKPMKRVRPPGTSSIMGANLDLPSATQPVAHIAPHAVSDTAESSSRSLSSSRQPLETTRRFRELELMHYWCTRTCNSFTQEIGEGLRDYIIQQGLQHNYLMEALLALTSLHMASESKDSALIDENVSEALQYQTRAVAGLRSTLGILSRENCDAVFIASLLITVCTIVSPLLQGKRSHPTQTTAEAMSKLHDFLNGIKSVLSVSRAWLEEGPVSLFLISRTLIDISSLKFPLEEIRQLSNTKKCDASERLVFEHAIDTLKDALHGGRRAFPWITTLKVEFLQALREEDDVALAIFMQWGVLLDQFHDLWWARFSGRLLVDEISRTLEIKGDEWIEITRWCRAQVGLCG
ncbi:hypothetical protein BKA66DRAFT_99901 [Pyrenochaeta sp. MPI-SDFR-AT-0127]|nr:hypothetical protein BKA66DRAFT_99901 [Pyrenochaeta sp. MPI-SDFR-AT-0127]